MDIRFQLTRQDLANYQFAVRNRVAARPRRESPWKEILLALAFGLVLLAAVTGAFLTLPHFTHRRIAEPEMAVGFFMGVTFMLASLWLNYFRQRRNVVNEGGPTLSPHLLSVEPQGLRITGPNLEHSYLWPIFKDITEFKSLLVLWMEPAHGLIIPHSAFGDEVSLKAFIEEVRAHISQSKSGTALGN